MDYHFQIIASSKLLFDLIRDKEVIHFKIEAEKCIIDNVVVSLSIRGKFEKAFLGKDLIFLKGVLAHVEDQPITLTYMADEKFKISELYI